MHHALSSDPTPTLLFTNKLILAPMVRIGTLPMRLLALRYGADFVFTPEVIAKKLAASTSKRIENKILGTVDFIDERANGGLILRIHPEERGKVVCQIGASEPTVAVQAALKVARDVTAIDLNCGCPKPFSVHDGSGAALLETPDLLVSILEALIAALDVPVTCKIRLLPPKDGKTTLERTKDLLKRVEATGISAVAIHCRFPYEKPREPGHWDIFEELAQSVKIPVIANGDIYKYEDIGKLQQVAPSISSWMFARGAQWNVSCFRKHGQYPIVYIMKEYLKLAIKYQMPYSTIKYVLVHMLQEGEMYHKMRSLKSLEEFASLFDVTMNDGAELFD